jgi:hypothetical protein
VTRPRVSTSPERGQGVLVDIEQEKTCTICEHLAATKMRKERSYHRHPMVSVSYPPIGPPRLLPVVAAMLT